MEALHTIIHDIHLARGQQGWWWVALLLCIVSLSDAKTKLNEVRCEAASWYQLFAITVSRFPLPGMGVRLPAHRGEWVSPIGRGVRPDPSNSKVETVGSGLNWFRRLMAPLVSAINLAF